MAQDWKLKKMLANIWSSIPWIGISLAKTDPTSIEAVSFALRVSYKEASQVRTVKCTACASKKNKTFHRKAFYAALHASAHLFDTVRLY